ncbi:MAG: L-aspartate oxidase, partial [Paenibacillus sp. RIFOXYA1_FULL_44_5]
MIPRYLTDFTLDDLQHVDTDVVVIGTGIAGLITAIKTSEQHKVLVVAKKSLLESNTRYAQGGIAAVISDEDSPSYHMQDTLIAGAGLCSPEAVNVLVHEGTDAVKELIRLGTQFDEENGALALTREGAHSQRRILHAHGDATGAEIVRALLEKLRQSVNIEVWDEHFAIDLVTQDGQCTGVLVQKPDGQKVYVQAKATIMASGGAGQLYRYTTNPEIATGDGVAMAYRAGAVIRDMEFIQFHPTSLSYPGAPRFLISEAVRGEGAVLRNIKGERFMQDYHPQLELAPRDVVARAIVSEIDKTKATFIYLDITHESPEMVKHRFPTIYHYCMQYGLDLTTDWIPVAPAAHYMMGGIRTDLHGETSIPRLFACGEVSSTGVHGANRLASNSLSEAVVFGRRIAERILQLEPLSITPHMQMNMLRKEALKQPIVEKKLKLQKTMVRYVGLKRSLQGLMKGYEEIKRQMP